MFDYMMTKEQLKIRDEARELVKWVPRQMILDMDTDTIKFPREFLQEAGRRNLMGCRYPRKWGGRDLDWVTTCMLMEEIGTLGYEFACVFGVGAELVCDAIILHGTDEQKEKYVKPLLRGEIFAAECLTEPRGGSDFFGATSTAKRDGDVYILNGQKQFITNAGFADLFITYAQVDETKFTSFIDNFKDTSLVIIVSIFDFLYAVKQSVVSDLDWRHYFIEGYLFAMAVYWVFCYAMSRYSQWLERHLNRDFRA